MAASQPTAERNVAAPSASASQARNGVGTPLARQNTSLGSFDFLKLFELGPNGEPLNFAEVLASNPDWADQNADQSADPGEPGRAKPLESSRNPGGGAEPASQPSDGSLLQEALKLTGPVSPKSKEGQLLVSQTSLARLLSSGEFGDLVSRQSLTSQLSKDPSFTSAVFQSLLAQKSEDQAMLLSMLGIEQQGASAAQPGGKDAAAGIATSAAPGRISPQQSSPPPQLPRLQVPEKALQSQLPQITVQQGPSLMLQQGPLAATSEPLASSQRLQNPLPTPPVLESKVISQRSNGRPPTAPVRPQANGGRSQTWQIFQRPRGSSPSPAAGNGSTGAVLEQRVDSLDYMLTASSPAPSGANGKTSGISFKPLPGGGPASLWRPPQPTTPRLEDRGAPEAARHFPRAGNSVARFQGSVVQSPQQRILAGLPPLAVPPLTQERLSTAGASKSGPTMPNLPETPGAPGVVPQLQTAATTAMQVPPVEAEPKSKFLNGLMTGIVPRSSQPSQVVAGPAAAAAAAATVLQLPKPVLTPLPPLPGVPSIQEYQRKLAAPGSQPRLEVLPLDGTSTPQVAPVRLQFRPDQLAKPPKLEAWQSGTPAASAAARGYLKSWMVQTSSAQLPASTGLGAVKAGSPSPGVARSSISVDTASSGSVAEGRATKKARTGGGVTSAPRVTASSGASEDGGQDTEDEGNQQLDRKELRKAKNRASAAASRARREAYTASLEEEVQRLQKEQEWLKLQVNALNNMNGVGSRRPKRQLSI